jgi:Pyridine nucleotide-disulphide oxidoreductase.
VEVAIIGGGFAGLSAAQEASKFSDDVTLFHRKPYSEERSGCWGQGIKDFSRFPVQRDLDGYLRDLNQAKLEDGNGSGEVSFADGVVIERSRFENSWASRLDVDMIQERIDRFKLEQISRDAKLVVDCSGPFPVSKKLRDFSYSLIAPMLNCKVYGDFSDIYPDVKVIKYKRYFLEMMPETEERCNISIGCSRENEPAEMYEDMETILSDRDIDVPDFNEVTHGNYVSNSLLTILRHSKFRINGAEVKLAGDALGISSGISGFGNSRASWSGTQAAKTYFAGESYPKKIFFDQFLSRAMHTTFKPLHRQLGIVSSMRYLGGSELEVGRLGDPRGLRDLLRATKQIARCKIN